MQNELYSKERQKVVKQGDFEGYKWKITTGMQGYPCAYIVLPYWSVYQIFEYFGGGLEHANIGHGGVTYCKDNVIGWDYGHYGDYSPGHENGKVWSVEMIEAQLMYIIKNFTCFDDYEWDNNKIIPSQQPNWNNLPYENTNPTTKPVPSNQNSVLAAYTSKKRNYKPLSFNDNDISDLYNIKPNKNESKNMNRKNTIRLTESELKRVISESVKKLLMNALNLKLE